MVLFHFRRGSEATVLCLGAVPGLATPAGGFWTVARCRSVGRDFDFILIVPSGWCWLDGSVYA